ncbi:YbjN domain-containing protein [Gordonia westfalica]|uniref:Putative sensory transduction regulator n=1 Tax=Gordonia westfalica TaxID=158898 RepID=A0A1H2K1H1_9ACTN|nr:YbjN domain-containing protein [Gordonia westfalica]SDU62413.1 Putative sensory transduction regulator [Gordonia westfalica]
MSRTEVVDLLEKTLTENEIAYSRKSGGGADVDHVILELPGEQKLKTTVLLTASEHGVRVEAFVCRRPDENHSGVYKYLLKRNRRLYGVAYTIDNTGDIYLVGRISADALGSDELDRVLGQVLEAADGDFNTLLELGFLASIQREWAWRVSRGESLRNLLAFEHLIDKESLPEAGAPLEGRYVPGESVVEGAQTSSDEGPSED